MYQRITLLLVLLMGLFACTEKEILIEQTHVNETIDDNTAPPFNGITTVQIHNYINKVFIDLIGREPSQEELDNITTFLRDNDVADAAIDELMINLMTSPAYYQRLWEIYSASMLGGFTRENVAEQIAVYQFLYEQSLAQGDELTAQFILQQQGRYQDLFQAVPAYRNGLIGIGEFLGRMINNEVYEEINMGSENFVIASFENLFKRLPTDIELANGVTMVDGFPAALLFQDGSSRGDFVNIMTTDPEFYQGLCLDIYRQFFARTPTSPEMTEATLQLSEDQDFQALQRKIMKTQEYRGF